MTEQLPAIERHNLSRAYVLTRIAVMLAATVWESARGGRSSRYTLAKHEGSTVILIDEGIATGASMIVAS